MIQLENVKKVYNDQVSIGPINVSLPKASITAMIGPSGAGKSTILTMMGRLLSLDQGKVTMGGIDIHQQPSDEVAKHLAVLLQENHFTARLTVRQLAYFGRFPSNKGRLSQKDYERVDYYLEFLGLLAIQDRYLDEISGGQRQRAFIAMVLCQETEYILLDEPLNNLDIAHSVNLMKQLRLACDQFGRTIVIVLHDINMASQYADYICAIKDGQLFQAGKVKDVMKSQTLSDLFQTPVDVMETDRGLVAVY
ncbi:ABC transporter ATP-binding protein [Facklamia sp. 7083-14-GEN3]|uniref:iron ABC transporter ATP-binding protein n=1 Tax=Facklamia sp. 7083-14-GEN3 TaxID=2973478 RepID=UPI00215D5273|nr:ATP-binding cassette domain-containing protein [Facklamia sp. 7083-14-GEN3]MCR8968430.1 ATP-binding cassette domain-containing protein [Facklamia sp. 7083-14-GEN3]